MPDDKPSIPAGYGTVTPWLITPDSAAQIAFLEQAFDARETPGSRMLGPSGSIDHVEVTIGIATQNRQRKLLSVLGEAAAV